jgi:glucose/arabinose dehydrogenase
VALIVVAGLLVACRVAAPAQPAPTESAGDEDDPDYSRASSSPTSTPRPLPTAGLAGQRSEIVAEGLVLPQSLAFAPDGRLFLVEVHRGTARVIQNGVLQPQPILQVEVARGAEHGLIGLALDPAYAQNGFLYTYYTEPVKGNQARDPRRNRVTRWTESGGTARDEVAILENLPVGKCCHTGGKMVFRPDGSLFLTVGDQGDASRQLAQDPNVANGKLLLLDPRLIARQQPPVSSLVWASGLRNPYGIDLQPGTGLPFITDNGPDMCDELNLGRRGANFGNPVVECSEPRGGFEPPIWDSGVDRYGLTGLRFYQGAMFPELVGQPLFCSVNTGQILRGVMSADGERVERLDELLTGRQDGEGCRLDLAVAGDGSIYYASFSRIYRLAR